MTQLKKYAIIVAGGSGSRMNGGIPKQFLPLAGLPILMHALRCFHEADASIQLIVAIAENQMESWKKSCDTHSFSIPHDLVAGGNTRFHSVKNGLNAVKEKSLVAVHDGARPFASKRIINRCFLEAGKYGNAVPAIFISESMRKTEGSRSEIVDRNKFVLIQTPQCFDSEILIRAYRVDDQPSFTDDASVVEHSGESVHLIEGERENIKITYPLDLAIGEAILEKYFQEKS